MSRNRVCFFFALPTVIFCFLDAFNYWRGQPKYSVYFPTSDCSSVVHLFLCSCNTCIAWAVYWHICHSRMIEQLILSLTCTLLIYVLQKSIALINHDDVRTLGTCIIQVLFTMWVCLLKCVVVSFILNRWMYFFPNPVVFVYLSLLFIYFLIFCSLLLATVIRLLLFPFL